MTKLRRDIAAMRQVRETQRGERRRHDVPRRGDRRLHQRRQVEPAQRADRRGRAGRGRAVRHPGPHHPPRRHRRTGGPTRSPTRSGSSGTCRTSSSRRSARRWRRRRGRTCSCTSSTPRTRCRRTRSRPSARCSSRSARSTAAGCRASCWWSTRRDAAGDLALARLRHLLPDAVFVSARRGDGIERLRARIAELLPQPGRWTSSCCCPTPRARSRRGCTPRARCSPRSTPPTAPGCTPGSVPSSPRRCCRSRASGDRASRNGSARPGGSGS